MKSDVSKKVSKRDVPTKSKDKSNPLPNRPNTKSISKHEPLKPEKIKKQIKQISAKGSNEIANIFKNTKVAIVEKIKEERKAAKPKPEKKIEKKSLNGLKLFTEEELGIGKGGDSKLCPFEY
jgi:hypothetical protein